MTGRATPPGILATGSLILMLVAGTVVVLTACVAPQTEITPVATPEEIYILRSIRERKETVPGWCASSRTGFNPFPADAERFFTFWSIGSSPEDGRVVDAHVARVAELRACFGPTSERARQNFYAEIRLGALSFRGHGECLALGIDFPEKGLFPVRCQLVLKGFPSPYVGGLLTTNTLTSRAAFGGTTEPPGYTQASIATIRLWKAGTGR